MNPRRPSDLQRFGPLAFGRTTTCFHYGPERSSMLSPFGHPAHDTRAILTCVLAALYEVSASPHHRTGGVMSERDIFVTEDDARKLRTLLASSSTTNWIVRASSRQARSQRTWSR